ncbi:MAG: ABC transporter substrate-binding protein [Acidimicrobiia bacterium]|nr:ABC transporter substrate-binding protein [Acidimicrobiia bacterium]MCY4457247.1 ABC transporter substrate-binding protein [Acidimicrobiaceae bacterium]
MRKKTSIRLLAAMLALALVAAACGGDSAETGPATTAPSADADNNMDESEDSDDNGMDEDDNSDGNSMDEDDNSDGMDEDDNDGTSADEVTTTTSEAVPAPPPEPTPVPGFDGSTIRVGVISDLSGPASIIGVPLTAGAQVYYDYVNSQGGIAGRYMIETNEQDHQYMPSIALQVYNSIKDDVVLIGQLLGTPITNAVLESLKQDNIVAAPASLDSFWVREQNLLPIGSPYQIQAINGLDWWINEGGGNVNQTYCTFVQDDPYGEAGQEGVEFAAEALGFTITESVSYVAGDTDFSAQIQQLSNAGCEVVYFVALPNVTAPALGEAASKEFAPTWISASPTWVNILALSPVAEYLQKTMIIVGEGSTWGDTEVEGMGPMLERLAEFAPDQGPDYYFTFGYLQAHAVVQVLEAAVANGDLSRQGIIDAMNSLGEVSFEGLGGDYFYGAPADRIPSTENTIFRVNPAVPNGVEAEVVGYEASFASDFAFN